MFVTKAWINSTNIEDETLNSGIFALCGASLTKATLPKLDVDTFSPIGEKRDLSRSQIAVSDFKKKFTQKGR